MYSIVSEIKRTSFFFSGDLFSANLTNYDLRTWLSGETVTIDDAVYVPSDLPTGTYEVAKPY